MGSSSSFYLLTSLLLPIVYITYKILKIKKHINLIMETYLYPLNFINIFSLPVP